MRISRLFAIPLLTILLFSAVMPVARAATAGDDQCFCYFAGIGATKADAKDATTCRDACMKDPVNSAYFEGSQWAEDFGQWPNANLRCWQDRTDCEKDLDMRPDSMGVMTIDGVWGQDQPSECVFGSHYCYAAENAKTYLNVSIAGTDSVVNVGEYVSVVYNYLMGFAMTVAIVFLMIGGLRYVIGGVSAESIKGAKKMMTQAIEGFVLLMFAYAILYTVSPQLIKLQVPKLPMARQVVIGGNDCALLLGLEKTDSGAEIDSNWESVTDTSAYGDNAEISAKNGAVLRFKDSSSKKNAVCGVTAEIMTGPEQAPTVEGLTCNFNYCAPGKGGCASTPTGGKCILCEEVKMDNPYGAVPSASICSQLDPPDPLTRNEDGSNSGTYNYCGYSHQPYMFVSEAGATVATVAAAAAGIATVESGGWGTLAVALPYLASVGPDLIAGACGSLSVNCDALKKCSDYNGIQVEGGVGTSTLSNLDYPSPFGDPTIMNICAQDPCGVGARVHSACSYFDGSGVAASTATGISIGCIDSALVAASKLVEDTYQRMRDAPSGSDEAKTASDEYYAALSAYTALGGE